MAVLKAGMSGQHVRDLQRMLNKLAVMQPLLRVDGIFGPKTDASVRQFQKDRGLDVDGVVGPLTSKALVAAAMTATLAPMFASARPRS